MMQTSFVLWIVLRLPASTPRAVLAQHNSPAESSDGTMAILLRIPILRAIPMRAPDKRTASTSTTSTIVSMPS
jgi:hypothetical protein